MHPWLRHPACFHPRTLALLFGLLFPALGIAQEIPRKKWPEISPYKNILLRGADNLSAVGQEGRHFRLLKIGARKVLPESGEGFEVTEWALEDSGRVEPVSSLVWARFQDDTVTLVVGHGPEKSALAFTELRLGTAGFRAVYPESVDPTRRPPTRGYSQAARTAISVGCMVVGGSAGGVIGYGVGNENAVGTGSQRDKEVMGYGLGGFLVGAAVGTFAAILLLHRE